MFRALLPAFPDRLPAGTKAMMARPGSAASTSRPGVRLLLRDVRRRLRRPLDERRPRRGAGARPEHRERADRGDGAQLPGADRRARARRGLRRRRAASAAASGCARTTSSTARRPSRSSPTATRAARRERSAASTGARRSTFSSGTANETRLGSKTTVELEAGDVVSCRTCGGGGYGPPERARPRARRRATCARAR